MLQSITLFEGLDEHALAAVTARSAVKTFQKNTIIIHEGDESDSLYIIMDGKVKIFLSDADGKEVIVATAGPGNYFGELAHIDKAPRSASVMTLDRAKFVVISGREFVELMQENPVIALNLIRELARRLKITTGNVRSFALMDVYGRVSKLLREMAVDEENGKKVIVEKPTQQAIANMVGASREMVSRILKELSVGGYISTEGKRLTINRDLPSAW